MGQQPWVVYIHIREFASCSPPVSLPSRVFPGYQVCSGEDIHPNRWIVCTSIIRKGLNLSVLFLETPR